MAQIRTVSAAEAIREIRKRGPVYVSALIVPDDTVWLEVKKEDLVFTVQAIQDENPDVEFHIWRDGGLYVSAV